MLATANLDSKTILAGIRQWVEIETPTDIPDQVNRLVTLADGYHDLAPRARLLYRLNQSLR